MLHTWRIDAAEYERHEARRGSRHAFTSLDARRTALVVVDMVPFFVDENAYARGIVPNVRRLAAALRSRGGVVAWVVPAAPAVPDPIADEFYGCEVAARYRASGGAGAPATRVAPQLGVEPGDVTVEKSAASALFPGRSPLPDLLRDRGVENVVVAGTVANVCCESTARDGATLGYRVVMVADANAASGDDELNATLRTVYRSFGDVRTTDEVLALLDR